MLIDFNGSEMTGKRAEDLLHRRRASPRTRTACPATAAADRHLGPAAGHPRHHHPGLRRRRVARGGPHHRRGADAGAHRRAHLALARPDPSTGSTRTRCTSSSRRHGADRGPVEDPMRPGAGGVRPSWESYFIEIAQVVATRSTCLRRQVGAVLVKKRQILTTGYNGVPRGLAHCAERGCLREQLGIPSGERHELCRGLHAEQNAIIQAAYHGSRDRGRRALLHPSALRPLRQDAGQRGHHRGVLRRRLPRRPRAGGVRRGGHAAGAG